MNSLLTHLPTHTHTTPTHTQTYLLCSSLWHRREEQEEELPRPSTTEWEKFADQLAKSRKFKPYESFAHSLNYLSVYKDYTSMRDKPGHYDGHFSEGNSLSSTLSDLSSGHLTPAPPKRRHGHRDYAKFVGSEQPGSVSRASSRLSNGGAARTFDFNPQRDRISLPIGNTSSRAGSRVGSAAVNGRRSLWARGQPDVLHEEPHVYSPVALRRSSMTTGLGTGALRAVRDERGLLAARSTSSLATSPLPARIDAKNSGHKAREPTRSISNSTTSPRPIGVDTKTNDNQPGQPAVDAVGKHPLGARRTSEPFKDIHSLRSEGTSLSLSSKSIKNSSNTRFASSQKEDKLELSAPFKSLLLDSARNISTTVMLATPIMGTEGTHSPTSGQFHIEPHCTTKISNSHMPLASRSSTFIADASESRKLAMPTETSVVLNASRSPASSRVFPMGREASRTSQRERHHSRASLRHGSPPRAFAKKSDTSRASQSERDPSRAAQKERVPSRACLEETHDSRDSIVEQDPLMPVSTKASTPLGVDSVYRTPSKMIHKHDSAPTPKRQPTGASHASHASSRLSSGSSEEIVIKPLSHLNTPSAVSLSPDQVVLTEYEDVDLEAALARLADWRGSTTTLHSTHSQSSRLGRTSHTSSRLGSRRASPWIRHHTEHTTVPSSDFVELSNPTKLAEQLDRCEICCSEIVMK